jgi:hypothetical protein
MAFFTRDTETVSSGLHLPHVRDVPLAHWTQLGRSHRGDGERLAGQRDNNVPSLSSTSRMTSFGKAQMNSAFLMRRSKLFA